jgi:hypothetical protein
MRAMRALAALLVLVTACGGGGSARVDGGPAGGGDGGGEQACTAWTLAPASARGLEMMDEPPYETGRTTRVAVTTELAACEERAMPEVAVDDATLTATIRLAVWRQTEGDCAQAEGVIARPVALQLPAPGTWTLVADGAEPITVKVEAGATGQCGTGTECRRDCDCADGEACLRGVGLGGPFSACVRPCELDRDCAGAGVCADIADGFVRTCVLGDECDQGGEHACPAGFSCDVDADSCTPSFTLGQEARGPCRCDGDCQAGLRCVRSRPEEDAHCEVACPTGGPWCQGAHVCGPAAEDAAGLATTDSVCVWLGE